MKVEIEQRKLPQSVYFLDIILLGQCTTCSEPQRVCEYWLDVTEVASGPYSSELVPTYAGFEQDPQIEKRRGLNGVRTSFSIPRDLGLQTD